jgi:hypothetical protein
MLCEHDQDALTAAAADGAILQGKLRSQLETCRCCRATFDREVALFAAIDSGLNSKTNSETPASLLPRVRAAIAELPSPARRWVPSFAFAAITAAIVFAFFFLVRPSQHGPGNEANRAPSTAKSLPPNAGAESPRTASSVEVSANPHPPRLRISNPVLLIHSSQPEVIVPAEELEGYALLLTALKQRFDVSHALATTSDDGREQLDGAKPLVIAQLEVKPLENQESLASHQTEK